MTLRLTLLLVTTSGCSAAIRDIDSSLIDGATVVEVTWTTGKDARSHVVFESAGGLPLATRPGPSGTDHRALLIGLAPDSTARFRVVAGDHESDEQTIETGSLVDHFPPFELDGPAQDHYLVLPIYSIDGIGGIVVLDDVGNIVWQHLDTRGEYVTRARLARDGTGVIYNSSDLNGDPGATQELV